MNENFIGIYCIENILNHKKYIGSTKRGVERWKEHQYELRTNRHKNPHLQHSCNENGLDKFDFYILEECDEKDFENRENYYIDLYNTRNLNFGYNIALGGNAPMSGRHHTKKSIEKMSVANSGINNPNYEKERTPEVKEKISKTLMGHSVSEETRKLMSEKSKGRPVSDKTRDKMRINRAGKVFSKEWRENIRKALIGKKGLNSTSKFRGVSFYKSYKKWDAIFTFQRKHYRLGRFVNEIDAAKAYDKKCWEVYHRLDLLNFPEDYEGDD